MLTRREQRRRRGRQHSLFSGISLHVPVLSLLTHPRTWQRKPTAPPGTLPMLGGRCAASQPVSGRAACRVPGPPPLDRARVEWWGVGGQVQLGQPHQAIAAQHDLDKKQLAGMSGAFLRVEFAAQHYDPMCAAAAVTHLLLVACASSLASLPASLAFVPGCVI